MGNPLVDMRSLLSKTTKKTLIGEVTGNKNSKVTVRLRAGNEIVVWGDVLVGSDVLIRDGQVVATIGKEDVPVVYIP